MGIHSEKLVISNTRPKDSNNIDQLREDYELQLTDLRKTHAHALQTQKEEQERTTRDLASKDEVSAMRTRIAELELRNTELDGSVEASGRIIRAREETIEELKRHHEEVVTVRDQEVRHIRSEMDADHAVLSRHLEMANHELVRKGDEAAASRKEYSAITDALTKLLSKGAEKEGGGINNVLMNFSSAQPINLSHTPHSLHSTHIHTGTQDADELISKVSTYVRRWQKEAKVNRERAKEKLAFRNFARGDLALFLPTRNAAAKPWAAFNSMSYRSKYRSC